MDPKLDTNYYIIGPEYEKAEFIPGIQGRWIKKFKKKFLIRKSGDILYYRKKIISNGYPSVKIVRCILFEGQVFCPGQNKKAKIPVRIIKK